MPSQEYQRYVERLQTDGPRVKAGDQAKWFEVDRQESFPYPTQVYNKRRYVLGYITAGADGKPRALDAHAEKPWHLTDARIESQMSGEKVVGFSFDPQGAQYFGDLTGANIGKPMAIVLDNK